MLHSAIIGQIQCFSINNKKKLDLMVVDTVKEGIMKSIHKESKNIVFDLAGIEFIDSASFAMLIELNSEFNDSGKNFFLANVSSQVNDLIYLVQLENVLRIFSFDRIKADHAA